MSHAPGPWTVDEDSIDMMWSNSVGIRDAEGAHVAHTTRGYEDGPSMANARLLAAAPELLEACMEAKKYLEPDLVEPGRTVFWKLVAAIAKAECR